MRHLRRAEALGVSTRGAAVAELGPGASLGVGLAALLSGAGSYIALDVVRHAATPDSVSVFDDLVQLFEQRMAIPEPDEFPEIRPILPDNAFPADALTAGRLAESLAAEQVATIRASVIRSEINYVVPWDDPAVIQEGSLDIVYSQAVMEHVDELVPTYRAIHRWLRPGGLMQHQIDLRSHGTHAAWNGHWAIGDRTWRFVRGDAPINRQPASAHRSAIEDAGLRLVTWAEEPRTDGIRREQLVTRWRGLSDADLTTAGVFVQAFKPTL
jgi:hypothetical protein